MARKIKPATSAEFKTTIDPRASVLYHACLAEARHHHLTTKTYSGKFLRPHAPLVKEIIDAWPATFGHACESILDYGCGKGAQYEWVSHGDDASIPKGMTLEQFWGVPVTKHDPAFAPFSADPPMAHYDLVLCTHVLGSIPIADLSWYVGNLLTLARGVLYIAEKVGPVGKQVFSQPEAMPRWSVGEWRTHLQAIVDDHHRQNPGTLGTQALTIRNPRVCFTTRERTEDGVQMQTVWM